ncbi:ATP-binding protein [Desulfopila sp. IMCC35008]|uniref:ATP-binding protein n=1 Tax=Desulfopila sp. IMCC35008 TaxID=2653858 RepID=UPI0013D5336F|nr:ATP-binding protein [Desulfopila sp. IMCC35008]
MATKGNSSRQGGLETILIRFVPAWENRPDSEHEQAVIRLLVGFVAAAYILFAVFSKDGEHPYLIIAIIFLFFAVAVSIVVSIIRNPGVHPPRRIYGIITDNVSATAALFLNGDLTAPIFVVYLWVTFGNGFRFGKRYLLLSMTLSIFGFGSVLLLSDTWSAGTSVNLGLMVGLIALPLYVASLLSNLERALVNAQAASKAKSDFLATMSHEIRTPLNGLIGILSLLDRTELREKQQYYVDLMKNSSEWLLSVISDGLDFTKIEADELVIEAGPVDLSSTILSICKVYRAVASKKGIQLREDLSGLATPYIECDQNRLTQVLNNLLSNACKFTKEGEVVVEVASSALAEGRARLSCVVRDSGVGIAAGNLESIFAPFKQIKGEDADLRGGTGLGLAISSRLIRLMGGDIRVESAVNVGTTFSFYLDVPIASESDIRGQKEQLGNVFWQRPPLILLVEDNAINREVATTYLRQLGCEVLEAKNGLEAVACVKENVFDLVFMDCQMPVKDGYQASREIRLLEDTGKERKNVIIALTAHITNRDREKCFEAGMDDYMGKPYTMGSLQQVLSKWLAPIMITREAPASPAGILRTEAVIEVGGGVTSLSSRQVIHDLRNALGGIIGGVELALLATEDPVKCEHHLRTALKGAQQAIKISTELSGRYDKTVDYGK